MIPRFHLLFAFALLTPPLLSAMDDEAGRIQPWPENPRYWQFRGEPVLFVGASDDDNLFQWPAGRLLPHLDALVAAGGNQVRNTMSDRDEGNLRAFQEVKPGVYDLSQPNPAYWERLEELLNATAERGILVQIEIWDRFDYSGDSWARNPWNPAHNVNYSYDSSGFAEVYPLHPNTNQQPFFFTPPALHDNAVVRPFQEAFVRKLLDHSIQHGHVLYCIDNETNGTEEWATYWARFLREESEARGRPIEITQMWDEWRTYHPMHQRTVGHPERYDYIDLSQNNQQVGQTHWDNARIIYRQIAGNPRPINSTKIYGSEEWAVRWEGRDAGNALRNFWRNLIGGFATNRFHRPGGGLGLSEESKRMMRMTREWEARYPVFHSQPDDFYELLVERGHDEAYAASVPETAWTVFFPTGGAVGLRLKPDLPVTVHWGDLETGGWSAGETTVPDIGILELSPPAGGMAVAVVQLREP